MACSVFARTRELGVRLALGAQRSELLRLVLREGLALIVAGLISGLFAAGAAVRQLKTQLYEVSAEDPATFIAVAPLLGVVALATCYLPARRATNSDPTWHCAASNEESSQIRARFTKGMVKRLGVLKSGSLG